MNDSETDLEPRDPRRIVVLALALILIVVSGVISWLGDRDGSAKVAASATGRIGLVLAALWLAWPSLRRPASWLPPGIAVAGVCVLAVLAAQPRLLIVLLPAFGTLLAISALVRSMRG